MRDMFTTKKKEKENLILFRDEEFKILLQLIQTNFLLFTRFDN